MITLNANRTRKLASGVGLGLAVGALGLVAGCGTDDTKAEPETVEIIVLDRSHSMSRIESWPTEAGSVATETVTRAFEHGSDRVVLVSLGAKTADAAKVADVDLNLKCANAKRCRDDRDAIAAQIGKAAAQLAATPVGEQGTDILAALDTAKAICGDATCTITVLSDGIDGRVAGDEPVKALIRRYASDVPELDGAVVHIIGLGADGSGRELVERARAFLTGVLEPAGATDIVIARSI